MTTQALPVGGPIWTRPFKTLIGVAALGLIFMLWRFVFGLGATTALNDGYPWGLWIAFDVVTGTALAAGGYCIALLCYVLNRGRYHPLVRPAILTSALGYTMAALSIVLDVGRYWNMWRVPLLAWHWNANSVLLEVALCVMAYTFVLWIEFSDAMLEEWEASSTHGLLRRGARWAHPHLRKVLPWVIALGVLLPTMHQSALGTLMVVSVKVHPIWHSPLLPLLFLVSCLGMGFGGVVIESTLSGLTFHRKPEWGLLSRLSKIIAGVLVLFIAIRLGDLAVRNGPTLGLRAFRPTVIFLLEILLFALPIPILLSKNKRKDPGWMFAAAMIVVLAGAFYRFNVYLIGFNPGTSWHYFPSIPEMLTSTSLIAIEIALYLVMVKRFPILSGARTESAR